MNTQTPSRWHIKGSNLADLFNQASHSRDFCTVREEFFRGRLRLIALLFCGLAAFWIGVDYIFLMEEQFLAIAPLMAVLTVLFGSVYYVSTLSRFQHRASWLFSGFFALVIGFYLISRILLPDPGLEQSMIIGYHFAPFLLVTMLALFPMTMVEAFLYQGLIFLAYIGSELFYGGFEEITKIGDIWLLGMMAGMVVWAQLSQLHMLMRLYREASYDVLTGLVNRRVITKWLSYEMVDALENHQPLSLLLFDLDHFKKINDVHGHLIGDEVLQNFGGLLSTHINSPQMVARFGGEEFLAVLPGADLEQAKELAETIREGCHHVRVKGGDGEPLPFSVSIGATTLKEKDSESSFIGRVDEILYQAKESGRDFVSVG